MAAGSLLAGILLLPSLAAQPRNPPAPRYFGVNLASASFAPDKLPGVHGQDYLYPTAAIARPFVAMGMNTARLPVLWERLQPRPFGPLNEDEVRRLDQSIADLRGFSTVIVDVHNYARHGGRPLDVQPASSNMLADLWSKLAQRYKSDPRVAFGIMNEPYGVDAKRWRAIADGTIVAIRQTGARNLILVPGTRWTGGHSWTTGGADSNARTLSGISDPADNMVIEMHQYLDADSSGTNKDCVAGKVGSRRLVAATNWLRKEGAKAILAEFGVPPTPACLEGLDDMLSYLRANGDVWVGWTYWAGGDWWGDYPYSIQPESGRSKPQAAILSRHIASYR